MVRSFLSLRFNFMELMLSSKDSLLKASVVVLLCPPNYSCYDKIDHTIVDRNRPSINDHIL
jgi:hypothetical protein